MPTRVIYNSNRFIPAPFVGITKQYQKTADQEIIGSTFAITLVGKQLAYKGSPSSSGVWYTGSTYPADEVIGDESRLGAIIRKQEAIRTAFNVHGRDLEIQSADGTAPMKCNPRIVSIEFNNDLWYNHFDYTINLEADVIYVNGQAIGEDNFTDYIEEASETWSFDTDEDRPEGLDVPRTYRVTHNVSAKGKRFYDETGTLVKPAWKQAQSYCIGKLGFDNTIALSSGVNNLPSYYSAYNHVRNEQIDEQGGSFSVTELFVLSSGNAIEDFNVSTRTSLADGLTTVSIEGNIIGLETRDGNFNVSSSKYTNASSKLTQVQSLLLSRAQTYSGETLNVTPVSTTVGKNPLTGTINYSYEYNNRPSNLITGSKSENISVQDSWGVQSIAIIPILGRTLGPIIQDLGTYRERSRTLSIELVMPTASGSITNRLYTNKPTINATTLAELNSIINAMNPSNFGASSVKVTDQNQSWDSSRFTYNASWVYELAQGTII